MLAGAKGGEGVFGVVWDGGVDVDGVNVRIGENVGVVGVALFDAELVADFVEQFGITLADRAHLRIGMALVDGDELGAEAEPDDGDARFCDGRSHVVERTVPKNWQVPSRPPVVLEADGRILCDSSPGGI